MKYQQKKKINSSAIIGREKSFIMKNYSHIECKVNSGVLYCYGSFQPTNESDIYKYRVKYRPYSSPVTIITSHHISYNDDIHMFPKDNSLCLYHKTDMVWDSSRHHIYDTIIPWTHEWFVYYELYLLCGEWLHPFVAHKKNIKQKED